jgi:hypothetical protein
MKSHSFLPLIALLAAGPAIAQTSYSPEDFAVVASGEKSTFDFRSVRTLGDQTRFELMIALRPDPDRVAGELAKRQVRYVARCAQGEMALAAVALIDGNGRMLKNIVVPPGAGEFRKPDADSPEAEWLAKACR